MSLKLLVKKIERIDKKFIVASELKKDCKMLALEYITAVKYLIRNRYIARVFRGIFYVYSISERKIGNIDMNFYDILKKAMKIKGVNNWYFGLETALKFNNLTHEYFNVVYIVNDSIFRAKPINIMGRKVKFYKLVSKMFSFGIINKRVYSDPEKTALDLLYLKHISNSEFKELSEKLSKKKLKNYSKNYSKRILEEVNK